MPQDFSSKSPRRNDMFPWLLIYAQLYQMLTVAQDIFLCYVHPEYSILHLSASLTQLLHWFSSFTSAGRTVSVPSTQLVWRLDRFVILSRSSQLTGYCLTVRQVAYCALDGESVWKTGVDYAKECVSVQVHRGHGGFHREQRAHKVDLLFFSICSLCQFSALCVRPEPFDNENSW